MEPLQVQIVLKPSGSPAPSIETARVALEDWARDRAIAIQDPFARDPDTLRFAVLYADTDAQAARILEELADADFVDGLYLKPTDSLP